ncbi:MAG: hypothetical protein ABH846_04320 [Patescibacteria group bacterium]
MSIEGFRGEMLPVNTLESDYEAEDTSRELWNDTDYISLSLRRHGPWSTKKEMWGALTPEGIKTSRQVAQEWAKQLPEDCEVSIYESPSAMPAVRENKTTGETKVLMPKRATITASLYEKAVFGDLTGVEVHQPTGEKQSKRRKRRDILGDFLHDVTDVQQLPDFLQLVIAKYGDVGKNFFDALITDTLVPEVEKMMNEMHGSNSKEMAQRIVQFLLDVKTEHQEKEEKQTAIGLTHEETLGSFLFQLDKFLESQNVDRKMRTGHFAYNEGMDLHIEKDGETLVIAKPNEKPLSINLKEFNDFLSREE